MRIMKLRKTDWAFIIGATDREVEIAIELANGTDKALYNGLLTLHNHLLEAKRIIGTLN